MFTVDGIYWEIPCTVERIAELQESEISGLMLNRVYFKDVIGTYMQYDIAIAVPINEVEQYTTLYEVLTAPVNYHNFTFPYNQTEINITGAISNVNDKLVRLANDKNYWRGTTFTVTAVVPSKQMTLDGVISSGMPPYPNDASASEGDMYKFTSGVWIPVYYSDADDIYY